MHHGITYNKPSVSITPCLVNALAALSELATQYFMVGIEATTHRLAGHPTVSIVTNGTPNVETIESRLTTWDIWMSATNDSETKFEDLL